MGGEETKDGLNDPRKSKGGLLGVSTLEDAEVSRNRDEDSRWGWGWCE